MPRETSARRARKVSSSTNGAVDSATHDGGDVQPAEVPRVGYGPLPPKRARKSSSTTGKTKPMSLIDMQNLLLTSTQQLSARMDAMAQKVDELVAGPIFTPATADVTEDEGALVTPETAHDEAGLYGPTEPAPCVPDDVSIDTAAFSQALQAMLTPPQSAHTSLATGGFMLAGSFLSVKVKTLIRQGQYVELGQMEPKSSSGPEQRNARWTAHQSTSASLSFAPPKVLKASSKEQWLRWFCTFAAVYTETFPKAAPGILSYIINMFRLFDSNTHTFRQALDYDEQFRLAKSVDTSLPWHKYELQVLANTGMSSPASSRSRSGQSGGAASVGSPSSTGRGAVCFSFNNPSTICHNRPCKYLHICQICRQNHPRFKCTSSKGVGRAESSSAPPSGRRAPTATVSKAPARGGGD